MKALRAYSTQVEADLARIVLEGEGIPATVVGISIGMEGGFGGVRLLVPEAQVEAALRVLQAFESGE